MIDLHSHILPGIDDGSKSLEMSLEMARIAVADGIRVMACTPHIYPGLYMNDTAGIIAARDALQASLDEHGIALQLTTGADVHLVPGLVKGLRAGDSAQPARHALRAARAIAPRRAAALRRTVFDLVADGYVPVITHPERLTWVEDHFPVFVGTHAPGRVDAGHGRRARPACSGPRAKYWGERFVGEGLTHILATDAHSSGRRVPVLSEGLAVAERLLGAEEAQQLVQGRPSAIMNDLPPSQAAPLPARKAGKSGGTSWLRRLLKR